MKIHHSIPWRDNLYLFNYRSVHTEPVKYFHKGGNQNGPAGDVWTLRSYLASANPGDIIEVSGTYSVSDGTIATSRNGSSGNYITIRGSGQRSHLSFHRIGRQCGHGPSVQNKQNHGLGRGVLRKQSGA